MITLSLPPVTQARSGRLAFNDHIPAPGQISVSVVCPVASTPVSHGHCVEMRNVGDDDDK